jgi:hypothetical protein
VTEESQMLDYGEMRTSQCHGWLGVDDLRGRNDIRSTAELTPCEDTGRVSPGLIRPYGQSAVD